MNNEQQWIDGGYPFTSSAGASYLVEAFEDPPMAPGESACSPGNAYSGPDEEHMSTPAQISEWTEPMHCDMQLAFTPKKKPKTTKAKTDRRTRQSKTKNRDPNLPKRPLSGYNFFFQERRKILLESLPDRIEGKPRNSHGKINFQKLAKTISSEWQNLDPEVKSVYQEKGIKERMRYYEEMKEYRKTTGTVNAKASTEEHKNPSPLPPGSTRRYHQVSQDQTVHQNTDPLHPLPIRSGPASIRELAGNLDRDFMDNFIRVFRGNDDPELPWGDGTSEPSRCSNGNWQEMEYQNSFQSW
eukprot:scaffold35385_cov137-Amphora_coffeaeformis.AAC.1